MVCSAGFTKTALLFTYERPRNALGFKTRESLNAFTEIGDTNRTALYIVVNEQMCPQRFFKRETAGTVTMKMIAGQFKISLQFHYHPEPGAVGTVAQQFTVLCAKSVGADDHAMALLVMYLHEIQISVGVANDNDPIDPIMNIVALHRQLCVPAPPDPRHKNHRCASYKFVVIRGECSSPKLNIWEVGVLSKQIVLKVDMPIAYEEQGGHAGRCLPHVKVFYANGRACIHGYTGCLPGANKRGFLCGPICRVVADNRDIFSDQ